MPRCCAPSPCQSGPPSRRSTTGACSRSARREATIPITPGCQPSPASTYAGAGRAPGSGHRPPIGSAPRRACAHGWPRPAPRRPAEPARVLGQDQLEPGVCPIEPAGGVQAWREREGDGALVDASRDARRPPPSARAGRACSCRPGIRSPRRTSAAVLAGQRHHVRDRRERHEVEVVAEDAAGLLGQRAGRAVAGGGVAPSQRACASLCATAVAQRSRHGYPQIAGCTIGASGSVPSARGAWWSVTTTASPSPRASATSSTAVIAQSTVTSSRVPPRRQAARRSRRSPRSRRRRGPAGTSRRPRPSARRARMSTAVEQMPSTS